MGHEAFRGGGSLSSQNPLTRGFTSQSPLPAPQMTFKRGGEGALPVRVPALLRAKRLNERLNNKEVGAISDHLPLCAATSG